MWKLKVLEKIINGTIKVFHFFAVSFVSNNYIKFELIFNSRDGPFRIKFSFNLKQY